jgi:hypothetical protein
VLASSFTQFAYVAVLLTASSNIFSQTQTPTVYWPSGVEWDTSVVSPKQHFGFEIGSRHLRHDQLVDYVKAIAANSNRFKLIEYGKTHGGRPLLLAIVTSPENHTKLNRLRQTHSQLAKPDDTTMVELDNVPVVINMGYGVHGDEPSASNCAALTAHYLAAARGNQIDQMLANMIVLLDPCLNPDGFDRFANWANAYRGKTPNSDPAHAEHNQGWPSGRTNYYWFDLNRDWLPLVHPESRARMKWYHQWKPDVVLDFHEMGTQSTYFFQPGILERTNPLTPLKNIELTKKIARYHAKALDQAGTLFMTEELFDDFYMGKGSTYPDLHGAVGILFEQASSRGHVQENQFGKLRFQDTIRNQFATSLSSLQATDDMRLELLQFKQEFYKEAFDKAKNSEFKTIVFSAQGNKSRLQALADMLLRHDIMCYWPKNQIQYGDANFSIDDSLIVPLTQNESGFLESLLDRRTNFQENVFYDVSSWNVSYAHNVKESKLKHSIPLEQLQLATIGERSASNIDFSDDDIAYLIDWREDRAANVVSRLLKNDLTVQVAQKPFAIDHDGQISTFGYGTISVAPTIQNRHASRRRSTQLIQKILTDGAKDGVHITPVKSSMTSAGIDLGSGSFPVLDKPSVAMVIGEGTSQYQAGEIWHLLDNKLKYPLTLIKSQALLRTDLNRYNTLILVGPFSESDAKTLSPWIKNGGTLIAIGDALTSVDLHLVERELMEIQDLATTTDDQHHHHLQRSFANQSTDNALKQIAGAIFQTRVDTTHPLGYGIGNMELPIFKAGTDKLLPSTNPYCNPLIYTDQPLLAGYASDENVTRISSSACVTVEPLGKGTIIAMVDDPVFRGYFVGTERLLINAILFGGQTGGR